MACRSAVSASAFFPMAMSASPRAICAIALPEPAATALSAVASAPGASSVRTCARAIAARAKGVAPASTACFAMASASVALPRRSVKLATAARASARAAPVAEPLACSYALAAASRSPIRS